MRSLFLFLALLFNSDFSCQENVKIVFGKPNREELLMKSYPQDTSAEAVFLYDKQNVEFFIDYNNIYTIKTIYHGRIKILKKSALDRGIIKIFLSKRDGSEELIEKIKGFTYSLENGEIITEELAKSSIFNEKVSDYERVVKLLIPNLKEGSVFEYTYTRLTPFNIKNRPNTWFFQGEIPYKWSDITIVVPGRFFYKIFYHGYLPFYINETKDTTQIFGDNLVKAVKYRYVIKDAPAFIGESFMTSYRDYIAKLDFELASYTSPSSREELKFSETWKDINNLLIKDGNFGERINKNDFLKDIAKPFQSINDTLEKIKAAYNYITTTMKWNGYYHLYVSENLSKAFENKVGSNAQINMILVALLRRLNIDANPAIISTSDNGEINESYPLLNKFNYTIAQAKVDGKDILMDATGKFARPNMLPFHSFTKKAFVIEKDGGRLITYKPKEKMVELSNVDCIINVQSKEIYGKCVLSYDGYKALAIRNRIEEIGEIEEIKNLERNNSEWQVKNAKLENKDSLIEPIRISCDFTYAITNQNEDILYFNPLFSNRYIENPFKEVDRIYPVDLSYLKEEIALVTIKIPEGYKIEGAPKTEMFTMPDRSVKFSYIINQDGDLLKIKSHLVLSKSYFWPQEYQNLRELFNKIVEKQEQQIVLRKK